MASVNSSTADYINKLYDSTQDRQKQMLVDAYSKGTEALDTAQQDVQKQTGSYLERTDVEAQKIDQGYKPKNVSDAVGQQAALTMENQQKKNTQMLREQQQTADSEIERMRKLYADQFSAAIKQAQAENDMARAQQLYEAAKAKEAELASFSASGGADRIKLIDEIYKKANEAGRLQMESELAGRLSGLYAQQQAQQQEMDRNLTQTYVDALKREQNYNEVQNAYGLGSGNMAQAQLARDTGLTHDLTELRRLQMAADAQAGQQVAGAEKSYADEIADIARANEQKRVAALYQDALTRKENTKTATGSAGSSGGGDVTGGYTSGTDTGGSAAAYDPEVLAQQQYLNEIGYNVTADGILGDETKEALKKLDEDRSEYRVINRNNSNGVQVDNNGMSGGMSWTDLEAAIDDGTVKEVFDDKNKTVHFVRP